MEQGYHYLFLKTGFQMYADDAIIYTHAKSVKEADLSHGASK